MATCDTTTITQSRLKSLLSYDPCTGEFRWLAKSGPRSPVPIGSTAGGLKQDGYIEIRVHGKGYRAHRLAWLYMTGSFPTGLVDHVDTDPTNNKWLNLREVTPAQNSQNRRLKPNKSGFIGAYENKGSGKWYSSIFIDGKSVYLGTFDTPQEAQGAYIDAKKVHHPFCSLIQPGIRPDEDRT